MAATSVVLLDRGNNTTCTINLYGKFPGDRSAAMISIAILFSNMVQSNKDPGRRQQKKRLRKLDTYSNI